MSDLVQFDDKWSDFLHKLSSSQISSYEQACEVVGFPYDYFTKVVDQAISYWRDSTTTSLLNGIANLSLKSVPTGNVFSDLIWQTRFLMMATKTKLLSRLDVRFVRKGKIVVQVKNDNALSVEGAGPFVVNKIIRALFLYWFVNTNKNVKLPKAIYRGIRAQDLMNHDTFGPAVAAIWKSDDTHVMKRKKAIDILIKWICDKKLHEITDAKLLSFTSSVSVAKYFSNGTGFCLIVDPTKVQIITSEVHDNDNIGGKDMMSGKAEKEYIVRIPDDYAFTPENIIINDLDYFIAEQNPMCVEMLDHDDKTASYKISGIPIEAYFQWNYSGNGGALRFRQIETGHSSYFLSRIEFKKSFGFDPLPNPKNIAEITEFGLAKRRSY